MCLIGFEKCKWKKEENTERKEERKKKKGRKEWWKEEENIFLVDLAPPSGHHTDCMAYSTLPRSIFWLLNSRTNWCHSKKWKWTAGTLPSQADLCVCAPRRTQPTRRVQPPAPAAPDPNRSSSHTRLCLTDPGHFPLQVSEGTTVNVRSRRSDIKGGAQRWPTWDFTVFENQLGCVGSPHAQFVQLLGCRETWHPLEEKRTTGTKRVLAKKLPLGLHLPSPQWKLWCLSDRRRGRSWHKQWGRLRPARLWSRTCFRSERSSRLQKKEARTMWKWPQRCLMFVVSLWIWWTWSENFQNRKRLHVRWNCNVSVNYF